MRTLFQLMVPSCEVSSDKAALSHKIQGWAYFWLELKRNPLLLLRNKNTLLNEVQRRQVFKCALWFMVSVFLNQISMYLIYRLADRPREKATFTILTLLCTAGVLISTHAVAALHRYSSSRAIVAALVAAGLLLFTADRFSSLSLKLMSRYGIGKEQKVNLLLNADGKGIVEALELQTSQSCSLPKMCEVEILSKVGNEYFLSVDGKTFTLPKSYVIAIQSTDRTNRILP